MRQMATYDLMETLRVTNQWLGATAQAMGAYPASAMMPNPVMQMMRAWGDVTERSFARMVAKPDWNIDTVVGSDGRDHVVTVETEIERPFGDLIRFAVSGRAPKARRILLVAPMSGHYATLLRSTVVSLLPDADVWITDWHNARDIPVSEGKFDVDDYTLYLADFIRELGPDINVIAVCQPAPLALAATAFLAEYDPEAQPATLTLIGGPIDPDAAATDVTDFGRRVTMGQLEKMMIQKVGFKHAGVGRKVYPGLLQLTSFISMNSETHIRAFRDQIMRTALGQAGDHDKHNKFYDEYLAVMDMPAEFYLSTVDRVFKRRDIARNDFTVNGTPVDIGLIDRVAVKIVEGENDDISAPGQCLAALDLLTGLSDDRKASHLEPGAGHYGIFAGRSWRNNIRPLVLNFIDDNAPRAAAPAPAARSEAKQPEVKPASDASAAKVEKPAEAKAETKPEPAKAERVKTETVKAEPAKAEPGKAGASASAQPKAAQAEDKPKAEPAKTPRRGKARRNKGATPV